MARTRAYGEKITAEIDGEVKRIIEECYQKAADIIKEHEDVLHKCAALLLEKEKINRTEFEELFGDRVFQQPENGAVVVEGI